MAEPIKVGDLVVIVRPTPCCGKTNSLGIVFITAPALPFTDCTHCGVRVEGPAMKVVGREDYYLISRLKRIPPLSGLEGEKRDEEITA